MKKSISAGDVAGNHYTPASRFFKRPLSAFALNNYRITNGRLITATAFLFLLPNIIFSIYLLSPISVVVLVGAFASWVFFNRIPAATKIGPLNADVNFPFLFACLIFGFALILLGGEGHYVYANADWLVRDAVLGDLSRAPELPMYNIGDASYVLRAPLGMYLTPAAISWVFGAKSAQQALIFQNGLLLGIILYTFSILMHGRRSIGIPILIIFGGLDIIGSLISSRHGPFRPQLDLPSHINNFGDWQYSNQLVQLFWVPNHALPGWWLASLIILASKRMLTIGFLGLSLAITLIWSPFAAIGSLPFIIYLFLRDFRAHVRSSQLMLCAITCCSFLPVFFYLVAGAQNIDHAATAKGIAFWRPYVFFITLSLLPSVVTLIDRRADDGMTRPLLWLSIAILLILPFFKFGQNNDLVMRASIPSLTIVAFFFARIFCDSPPARPFLAFATTLFAILIAFTPTFEIIRLFKFSSYRVSACNLSEVNRSLSPNQISPNYLVPMSKLSGVIFKPQAFRLVANSIVHDCWPDYPFDPRAFVGDYSNSELASMAAMRATSKGK